MGPRVVTTVDCTVPPDREQELRDGFRRMNEGERPDGLLHSELLRAREGAWRIQTTWRDMESLMALRQHGESPAALALLDRLGADHSHAVFTVEQRYKA